MVQRKIDTAFAYAAGLSATRKAHKRARVHLRATKISYLLMSSAPTALDPTMIRRILRSLTP